MDWYDEEVCLSLRLWRDVNNDMTGTQLEADDLGHGS